MSNYQERLSEEIERISDGNLSQLSKNIGVARNTLYNWQEKANIKLDQLVKLSKQGLDIGYVISGKKEQYAQNDLTEQEILLLREFGKLSDEQKQLTLGLLISGIGCMNKLVIHNGPNGTVVNHVGGRK